MYRPPLTDAEWASYVAACQDSKRTVRFWARLYNKGGTALSTPLTLLGGEVTVDATDPIQSPTRTASISLYDPTGKLNPQTTATVDGDHWFAKGLGIWAGLWVPDLDEWVDIPIFRGRVSEVTQRGAELEVDARGLEAGHIPPHSFAKPYSRHKHIRIGVVIKDILRVRGESKFSFPIDKHTRRLKRPVNYRIGASPWRSCMNLADALVRDEAKATEYQLYVRGDGVFRLRRWPASPCWIFNSKESASNLPQTSVLDDVDERISIDNTRNVFVVLTHKVFRRAAKVKRHLTEKSIATDTTIEVNSNADFIADGRVTIGKKPRQITRTISGVSGNTITLKRAVGRAFEKGTNVEVWVSATNKVTATGRAALRDNHPLSSMALSGGRRPLVKLTERDLKAEGEKKYTRYAKDVHAFRKEAQHKADAQARNAKVGVEHEFSFSAVPVYHLEPGDLVRAETINGYKTIRLKQYTLPLEADGTMEVGWGSKDVPRRRARKSGR